MAVTDATVDPEAPYARDGLPTLGFRNYWYPILKARRLGRRPRAVRLLGEQIVLFRDGGRLHALEDRCPHRGTRLSIGACRFPGSGTISCPYHGWTFRGADGTLAAALMEGPGAPIERKVRIQAYPVAEHAGLIWLFVGDMDAVPLADDLPEWIHDQERFFQISYVTDYRCNWRVLVDNWTNDHHAPYVHNMSPELVFQPHLPFAQRFEPAVREDGRSMRFPSYEGMRAADFPGLGRYPRRTWHRFLKPSGRGGSRNVITDKARNVYKMTDVYQTRLPGAVMIGRSNGEYALVQWAVPLDAETVRLVNINCFRRHGPLRALYDRVHYWLWRGWAHDIVFSGQDQRILEQLIPGAERLSRTDTGLIAWRKFAGANARRPDSGAKPTLRAAGD
ncbi:MAG TPA: aromatic ring-hydroxylating dioxygenase subunit alpha [Candidatus Sulfotelmatobacter sp.]|nr:aromatic ring-hydroxylating dioxygenase subunit alpha [Candidatus Sulfotelmatobacter sp.]